MLHSITREKLLLPIPGGVLISLMLSTSIFGSVLPPGATRSVVITSVLGYLVAEVMANPTGKLADDALLPIQSLVIFSRWASFYLLHNPEKEYKRLDRGKSSYGNQSDRREVEKISVVETPTTRWGKLKWATSLSMTLRGVGWNWEVKNIPPNPFHSKWQFVRRQLIKASLFYLCFDIIWYALQFSTYGSSHPPSLLSDTPLRQAFFGWVAGLINYFTLNIQYPIFAALTVGTGIYETNDWPPIMGKLRDVVTVRGFWGKFWHQCLRRTLSIPYEALTRIVPIRKGTLLSRYSQLYLAFIASALLHHYPLLRSGAENYSTLTYFLVQPLAITFEDWVIYLASQAGIEESWRTMTIGRIWTFAWFSFSLKYGSDTIYSQGMFAVQPMPSLCKSLAIFWRRAI